jgi:site-specific recombinase XerC
MFSVIAARHNPPIPAHHSLPDPIELIEYSDKADSTKRQYIKVLQGYLDSGDTLTDTRALSAYARTLSRSRRAFFKAAIKMWSQCMINLTKSQAAPDNLAQVQAALYRFEALQNAITVPPTKGRKVHTWLSQKQVKQLLDVCEPELVGQRDRLLLSILVGAGLRRRELARLTFGDVKHQPTRNGMRTVLEVEGKGSKHRVVPISNGLAQAIEEWGQVIKRKGRIARSLSKNGKVGDRLSTTAIFEIVRKRGGMIDKPGLAPHDLRRTYAQLGYQAGIPITQISKLLGHSSLATTQRYLNLDLDLEVTISDFIPV